MTNARNRTEESCNLKHMLQSLSLQVSSIILKLVYKLYIFLVSSICSSLQDKLGLKNYQFMAKAPNDYKKKLKKNCINKV